MRYWMIDLYYRFGLVGGCMKSPTYKNCSVHFSVADRATVGNDRVNEVGTLLRQAMYLEF